VRISLIHYTYSPAVGGVEQIVEQHALLLRDEGHEVSFVPELRAGSGDVEIETLRVLNLLRPRLRGQDVVFMHNVCTMPFHPALTAALWRLAEAMPETRFIAWVHDLAVANPDYTVPAEPAFPWSFFRQTCPHFEYVAVSELRRRQLLEHLAPAPKRLRVIPNGVAPFEHWGLSRRLGKLVSGWKLLDRDLVLHPARLLRRKNVEFGLETIAALRAAGRDAALLVTGPPDIHRPASATYAEAMRTLRQRLGLEEHVFFLADLFLLEDSEVASLYRLADAALFPSRQEGFGLPVLEAALHRLPLFCPDVEPMRSLPGAGAGVYPETATPAEVAERIMRQLDASPPIQARREVLRAHAWPALYRNLIAPLLAEGQTQHPSP
jgi:glycosyltransferase involved in cell wall biosynthesis